MQAPIGPASTPQLVGDVCAAGGLGTVAASWTPVDMLRSQIAAITCWTDRPFCVNLVLAFDQRERLELLIEEGVPCVSFSWGVSEELISRARSSGMTVFVQVGDVNAGAQAAGAGADVLIAQGCEAGGHVQSSTPVVDLVRALRPRVSQPLLAAGGIAGPEAVGAVLAAGASGIVAGSAYLVCPQADVHPAYREAVLLAQPTDTQMTGLFDVGWPDAPHRVIRNQTLAAWEAAGCPPPGSRPGEGERVAVRSGQPVVRYGDEQPTSDTSGDVESMALYAGTGVGAITETEDAAVVTERLLDAVARCSLAAS